MTIAFLFPGQGSQYVGMGRALVETFPAARRVFESADAALNMPLSKLCFEGPEEQLRLTANTQPAILTTSVAAHRVLVAHGIEPDFVAGHSLGEYSALVAAGALEFEDAVKLVHQRGIFMQEAVPPGEGAMAAIVGCDPATLSAVCEEASALGVCGPANINSPSQTVIAGHRAAVERAVELAKNKGAKRAVMLNVSAPFHSSLMQPAADRLAPVLEQVSFSDLAAPLVTNVDVEFIESGVAARDALQRQVASPVRWSESVGRLLERGVSDFIEVGPGKVLSGLARQVSRNCRVLNVEDPDSLAEVVQAVGEGALGSREVL